MAEIIWLFDKHGRKITTDKGRIEAARDFARNAELAQAAGKTAKLRPYEKFQGRVDTRLCVALKVHGLYLVLQFGENVSERNIGKAVPEDVWHIQPADFKTRFKMIRQAPVDGALFDQFHRHIFSSPTGVGRTAMFCAQKISAVYEAARAGTWQPEEEPRYTVDETGWRPIDRGVSLAKGDLLIQYEGGMIASGPAARMRNRLLPRPGRGFTPEP